MAVIQSYNDRVTAQGQLAGQASGNDFGAQVGAGVQALGAGVMDYANSMYELQADKDVTAAHATMAQKRLEWTQKLTDLANSTPPSQYETIMPSVVEGMKSDFEALGQNATTRRGQDAYAKLSSGLISEIGTQASAIQGHLSGIDARNQYNTTMESLGRTAAQDHTQWQSLVDQANGFIDTLTRVPQTTRDEFKQSAKDQIMFDAAKGFARRYPNAVLGTVPQELRGKVQQVIANPPTPGLPPDLKADTVKPYTQATIDSRAKMVAQPSPYDKTFQDAAQLYNLDWRELKMRAVAESGLNPTAVSSQNAGGIMQFTPEMATQLGVNRNDPVASIFAAAKLLSNYRTKAGGDISKVDMMYYGGEGGTAWGPNTKQYAANLAALRGAVGLGTQVAPEQFANPTAEVGASQDWVKAKTGIDFIDNLPANKFFDVLTEAEHYQRAYDSQSERSRIEQKHQQQVAAEAQMRLFTQRIVNPTPENGGALSEVEVVSSQALDSTQQQHILGFMNTHARELQARMEPKSNPANVRELMLRIHAPDNDSAKIYNDDPIYDALSKGKISTPEFAYLSKEVNELKSSSTNGFRRDVNSLRGQVARALQQNIELQAMEMANPGTIADISYRFDRDLEQKIEALRKENKDPSVLLDPTRSEYALRPGRLRQFFPSGTVNQGAANVASTQVAQLPTYREYDSLKSGASYTDPQGNVRVKR